MNHNTSISPSTSETARSERIHRSLSWHLPKTATTLAIAALLTACASSPLPEWKPYAGAATSAPTNGTVQPARAGKPASSATPAEAAVSVPVPTPGQDSAAPDAPPYNAAVAARFPAPPLAYATPGLAADRSTFTTNAEVSIWLHQLSATVPAGSATKAVVLPLGTSQAGVLLEGLLLTRAAGSDPATVLATQRPTVLLVGQQHGNEPAGAEALLVLARELSQGLLEPLLDRINVIVVPRANPDGAAANTRVTANGVDMNRDHLLLTTPEARALAKLSRDYQPIVVVDAHEYTVVGRFIEKFGAIQKYDALLQYAMTPNLPEFLPRASEEWFRRPVLTALKNQNLTQEWYYTTSTDPADKRVSMGGVQPDTGRNVNGLKNAVSLLIETRGVGIGRTHIQRRVHTQVTAITSVLQSAAARADELNKLRPYMEREISSKACNAPAVVEAAPTSTTFDLTMLDPETGADKVVNVPWNSSQNLRTVKSRVRPCGYWLSPSSTTAVERLRLLGLEVQRVTESSSLLVDSYQEQSRTQSAREDVRGTVAGSGDVTRVEVGLASGVIDAPAGSFYVPANQPWGNLAVAALEPDTQNSYFANHVLDVLSSAARVMSVPALKLEPVP
jgi:hypothetical protein